MSTRYIYLCSHSSKNVFSNGVQRDVLSTEGEMAKIRSSVICCLVMVCPNACVSDPSQPRRGERSHRLFPFAQPASTLKLRQAVIIYEETWTNGQEMQRYWLGWLLCTKPYRLAPTWWPVVSQVVVCGAVGGVTLPRCETRPPLAAVCHIRATPWRTEHGRQEKDRKSVAKLHTLVPCHKVPLRWVLSRNCK